MTTIESANVPTDEAPAADPVEAEARKLRRHFKFTREDLATNRLGELSDKQRKRIDGYERGGRNVGFVIGGGLTLMGAVFGFILVQLGLGFKDLASSFPALGFLVGGFGLLMGLIFGVVVLAMLGGGIFLIVSQFIPHKPYRVLSVRGRARLQHGTLGKNYHDYWDLYIGEQEFDGDGSMPNVITPGAEYIAYYLQGTEELISIERS